MRASSFLILLSSILLVVAIVSVASAEDDQPSSWFPMDTFHAVEDVPLIIDFTEFVTDPDTPTDNLTIDSGSPFVVNISGMVVTFLFPNGVLEANVTMEVSDGNATKTATLHFIIEPVNDPPRWKPSQVRLPDGEQDEFYSFNLTAIDEDDAVEDLTFSTDADFFIISPTGEIAFRPRNDAVGRNWFNVTVTDPGGLYDTMELVLFIGPYPEWIFIPIEPQVAHEGVVFALNISDYRVYNWAWIPLEDRLTFTYYDDSSKLNTNPETGEIVWDAPTNMDVGDHFFTITMVDSLGRASQVEIKITVPMPHPPPLFDVIGVQNLTQDIHYTFTMPMDPHYTTYSHIYGVYSFFNDPEDLFVIDPDKGVINFVPRNEHVGKWIVTIGVVDEFNLRETVVVVFNISNINDAPTMKHVYDLELIEGKPFQLRLEGRDVDMDLRQDGTRLPVDLEERLMFSGGPDGGHLDPVTGVWKITPDQGHVNASPMIVEFQVSDTGGLNDTIKVRISVKDVVMEPSVTILGVVEGQKLRTDRRVRLGAVSVDESGEEWAGSFRWYVDNTLIEMGREIEWRPRRSGHVELTLVAEDDEGNTARTTIVVSVRSVPNTEPLFPPFAVLMCIGGIIALVVTVNIYLFLGRRKVR